MTIRDQRLQPTYMQHAHLLKRVIDVVAAVGVLLLLSPLLLVVALLIKLEDGGPIFYFSQRVGRGGKHFGMFKFRSMVVNAQQQEIDIYTSGGALHCKRSDDPRVTRVGRWLRWTSLDELPQLVNVLRGEMSLVGPRPELVWVVDYYEVRHHRRFAVQPGITGWWQVHDRGNPDLASKLEQDLFYVEHQSLALDLWILWRTVAVVLSHQGAF